jgi:hypothetical protein
MVDDGTARVEVPPVDPGNPMVRHDYPSLVTTGYVNSPDGMRLALTVRVANATVTLIVTRDQAVALAATLHTDAMNMPGGGLIVPGPLGKVFPVAPKNGTQN